MITQGFELAAVAYANFSASFVSLLISAFTRPTFAQLTDNHDAIFQFQQGNGHESNHRFSRCGLDTF